MPISHDGRGAGSRARRLASVIAAVSLTGAGLVGISGEAQASPAVTAQLTATGTCDSGPNDATPYTTLATANITRSFQIRVSGKLTGLVPGHSYSVATNDGNMADGIADLGKADANGNLLVSNVLDDGGANGYLGTTVGAGIFDPADGNVLEGAPIVSTIIPIADNCSRLVANSSHDRLIQGTLRLIQQGDGNLVLYQGGKPRWNSRTGGHPGAQTVMQGDGNLVVYSPTGKPLWSSRTNQRADPGLTAVLVLQGDKNLVLYEQTPVSKVLWATYTN